ncbi:HNH endonuclease signature motif containing protein [Asticcacaulis sp.]|uniref:HNH endonuclease signature motif containing protein n=1 Tax=Asticcacaulis sp. TaxID=1872648 RepID=UPI002631CBB2|nr:HNH endonuclease signature motif containing protein [Asticcacaulis sp.]
MHNLPIPDIDDMVVFDTCISVKPAALRQRFETARNGVSAAYANYADRGTNDLLLGIQSILPFEHIALTTQEFRQLYAGQVLHKSGPARSIYDKIQLAARRCPFCSHGAPRTLDHFLPKESFAEFSVLSKNLVPCCRDCNGAKHSKVISADEQFFHPYFDQISGGTWLECRLDYGGGTPAPVFYVNMAAEGVAEPVLKKLEYQFGKLGLSAIYGTQAIDEIEGQMRYLCRLHQAGGTDEVTAFLAEQVESKAGHSVNSWQAALYRGLFRDANFSAMEWNV